MGVIVFFFSSRRRHTRSDRDWSSDVCSSDLASTSSCSCAASPASWTTTWPGDCTTCPPSPRDFRDFARRSEEHTSELQSRSDLVCRLLLEKKKINPPIKATAVTHALYTVIVS